MIISVVAVLPRPESQWTIYKMTWSGCGGGGGILVFSILLSRSRIIIRGATVPFRAAAEFLFQRISCATDKLSEKNQYTLLMRFLLHQSESFWRALRYILFIMCWSWRTFFSLLSHFVPNVMCTEWGFDGAHGNATADLKSPTSVRQSRNNDWTEESGLEFKETCTVNFLIADWSLNLHTCITSRLVANAILPTIIYNYFAKTSYTQRFLINTHASWETPPY